MGEDHEVKSTGIDWRSRSPNCPGTGNFVAMARRFAPAARIFPLGGNNVAAGEFRVPVATFFPVEATIHGRSGGWR